MNIETCAGRPPVRRVGRWLGPSVASLVCAATALTSLAAPAAAPAPPAPASAPSGADPKDPTPSADAVAVVAGQTITVLDVLLEFNRLLPQESYHGNLKPADQRALAKKALRNVILVELAAQAARRKGIAVSRPDLDAEIGRRTREAGGPQRLAAILKALQLDRAVWERTVERDLLSSRFIARDYGRPVSIGDADIKAYYDKEPQRFVQPEAVRLSIIEIRVDPSDQASRPTRKAIADSVHKQLAAGTLDFASTARKHSGADSAAKGGDMGWLHRASLGKEVEQVAFSLAIGNISPVIENLYGYNIIKVTDRRGPKQLAFVEINKEYWRGEIKRVRQREQIERGEARLLAGVTVAASDKVIDRIIRLRFAK